MEEIVIPKNIMDKMIDHARRDYPNECCGLLAGLKGEVYLFYEIDNDDKSTETYFMNPKELLRSQKDIREKKMELLGIYHSHTHSEAYPSETDMDKAHWPESDMPLFPESFYLIISLEDFEKPVTRVFDIKKKGITEKKFRVV